MQNIAEFYLKFFSSQCSEEILAVSARNNLSGLDVAVIVGNALFNMVAGIAFFAFQVEVSASLAQLEPYFYTRAKTLEP